MPTRVVKLRASPDILRKFDFSPTAADANLDAGVEPSDTGDSKRRRRRPPAAGTRARPKAEGLVGPFSGQDPILGNLPRSVKAAPVANMSGLDLDKTMTRKWKWEPVEIKSCTGYNYQLGTWTASGPPLKKQHNAAQPSSSPPEASNEPESSAPVSVKEEA